MEKKVEKHWSNVKNIINNTTKAELMPLKTTESLNALRIENHHQYKAAS